MRWGNNISRFPLGFHGHTVKQWSHVFVFVFFKKNTKQDIYSMSTNQYKCSLFSEAGVLFERKHHNQTSGKLTPLWKPKHFKHFVLKSTKNMIFKGTTLELHLSICMVKEKLSHLVWSFKTYLYRVKNKNVYIHICVCVCVCVCVCSNLIRIWTWTP